MVNFEGIKHLKGNTHVLCNAETAHNVFLAHCDILGSRSTVDRLWLPDCMISDHATSQSSALRPSPPAVRARSKATRMERVYQNLHLIAFPWTNQISLRRRFVPIFIHDCQSPNCMEWTQWSTCEFRSYCYRQLLCLHYMCMW